MRRSLWFATTAVTLALTPALASAQAAPSFAFGKADELKDVKQTEWNATAEAGLVVTTGNSRTTTVTGGVKVTRKQQQNKFSIDGAATFARASTTAIAAGADNVLTADEVTRTSVTSAESYNLKLRYDRFLSTWDSLYVAALGGADIIAGKDFVGGGQLGYARLMYKTEKHEISGELGYDFSYENLADGTSHNIQSARGFIGYKGKLRTETSLDGSLEVLANGNRESATVGPFEDTRAVGTAALSTKLSKGISLSVSITGKFDAAPAPFAAPAGVTLDAANPPENSKLDTLTKASLIITLL